MKKLILLLALLSPSIARANTVTPQFTTGSMNSTTTTTQTITEVEQRQVFGAAVDTWSGTNITPSADIAGSGTTYSAKLTPNANGAITTIIPVNGILDVANNFNDQSSNNDDESNNR